MNTFDPLSKKKYQIIFFGVLIFVTLFLRTYKIASIPNALYQDETAIGYNANSVLQTGKDEFGVSYPLYFKSFGDYKLPAYIYTTAVFIKIFGFNEYAVRLPSALAGSLTVILLFLLLKHLTKNVTYSFIVAFLLAINPWSLQFSRTGFEVNFALGFTFTGIYLFILGIDKKKFLFLIFSILAFGISLYSYNVTRLLVPIFIAGLSLLYWKKLQQFTLLKLVALGVLVLLIMTPFFVTLLSPSGALSAKSSLVTSTDVLAKDLEFRSYLTNLPPLYVKVFYNQYIYLLFQYLQNLANIVSGTFFYVAGSSNPNQGVGNFGTFYLFELPLFIAGLFLMYKKMITGIQIFLYWLLICVFVLALSKEVPHATRGYFLVIPEVVFSGLGLYYFIYFLKGMRNKVIQNMIVLFVILFVMYDTQFYFASYYLRAPALYAESWRYGDKELSLYLVNVGKSYNKIIFDPDIDLSYTSLLFYTNYPPAKFITSVKRYQDASLLKARSWDKYEFRPIHWQQDLSIPHALIVTTESNKPKYISAIKYFRNPTIHLVLSVNNAIISEPLDNIKYVLIDTDEVNKVAH